MTYNAPMRTLLCALALLVTARAFGDEAATLQPAASFGTIADETERSKALFVEMSKVILHPRCVNCHPTGDQPLRGDLEPHEPPVWRGTDDEGAVAMRCGTCHTSKNFDPAGVPGTPHWYLAPREAAWEGKSIAFVCRQIQDEERNGGMDHEDLINHMAEDPLVTWGWKPGAGREPVPGTQEGFAALARAWVATGAACPEKSRTVLD